MAPRNDFLSQQAPENYVAGLGRGATGFTTRSDLGPAREGPSEEQIKEALAKRAAQLGTSASSAYGATAKKGAEEDDNDDAPDQDPENEVGLFASGNYDREDDEADRIYQEVDEKLERRRKIRREAREAKERAEYEAKNPKISQQFADLKRPLGALTDEDWASIPEVGDLTGKNKRQKQNQRQRFYAVPDSVIAGARDSTQFESSISEDGTQTNGDNADGTMTNFADIGQARNKVLQVRLDQQANQQVSGDASAGTSTNIDPKGYLTSLSKSEFLAGEVQVGDINRARTLLESVTKTNRKHPPGWVARCRLEEIANRTVQARNIISQGCIECPKSEDCWSENIRLNTQGDNHNAKVIAAQALKQLPESVRLWKMASDLEADTTSKKRVLMTALDHNTRSVALWKELINLSDRESALLLLSKATSEIQISVDLWLAYARLAETPQQAQSILNRARKAVPTSHEIWISAARLQEQMEQGEERINTIMKRAIGSLVRESAGAMLKREEWIIEAEKCEEEGAILTCGAIIRETLGYSLDEDDDRKEIWLQDARDCISHDRFGTARYIYGYVLRVFPTSKSAYTAAIEFEREHGSKDALENILSSATEACPQVEEFWVDLAKQKRSKSLDESRRVLATAFQRMAGNENIWLSACDLESEAGQIDQARELLATARREAGTDRVYIKSVAFERIHARDNPTAALDLVNEGLARYPKAAKLYMMKGQIYEYDFVPPKIPEARKSYSDGIRACTSSVPLTVLLSRLEEKAGVLIKARSVLERSGLKDVYIWRERVRLERRAGNTGAAQNLMARALQEVPPASSGPLWAERIWHLEARNQRKPLALEAIKKAESDPGLFVTVARIFWSERRLEKAATWFEKAVLLDPDVGETWAWYLKFLRMHGTAEKREDVVNKCVSRAPRHGEVWQEVNKDPKNAGKPVNEILDMVIDKLE